MYPEKDYRLLQALVAKHGLYSIIKEILQLDDITEYQLLEICQIERLIETLQNIYVEIIKDEEYE